MDNPIINFRKKYILQVEKLLADGKFCEVTKILNDFNLNLEITHTIFYQKFVDDTLFDDDIVEDRTLLCYLYHNKLYDEISFRNFQQNRPIPLDSKRKSVKLFEISQKFKSLYVLQVFDDLEKYIYLTGKMTELRWTREHNKEEYKTYTFQNVRNAFASKGFFAGDMLISNYIYFSIDGITLFRIGGNELLVELSDNSSYTKKYFIEKTRQRTDLIDIQAMEWFYSLSDKSQILVKSGSQFLDKMFTGELDELLDYTPLLLNFSKALEAEIKDYYDDNFSFIWPIAELILSNEGLLKGSQIKGKYHVNKLFSICKEIVRFKENFAPSGHKPLPYILYYLGLGKDIDDVIDIDGFLSDNERKKVEKETALINRLFDTANNRNNYMHQTSIESKNEFLLHYYDIFQALNLLATIK